MIFIFILCSYILDGRLGIRSLSFILSNFFIRIYYFNNQEEKTMDDLLKKGSFKNHS